MSGSGKSVVPQDDGRLRALMVEYQAGRIEAFDELYGLVSPVVRRVLGARLRDAARVEDLVQESFLQVHRARHTYDAAYPVLPWMLAIVRHCWLMDMRRARRRPVADEGIEAHEPFVRAESEAYADAADLSRALSLVPPAQRQAVVAHHAWGYSFQEIGERLGIAAAAAKLRSSRGVRRLRTLVNRR